MGQIANVCIHIYERHFVIMQSIKKILQDRWIIKFISNFVWINKKHIEYQNVLILFHNFSALKWKSGWNSYPWKAILRWPTMCIFHETDNWLPNSLEILGHWMSVKLYNVWKWSGKKTDVRIPMVNFVVRKVKEKRKKIANCFVFVVMKSPELKLDNISSLIFISKLDFNLKKISS